MTNKIVITGHSRGIGRAIADDFQSRLWTVVGLSRSNGFDLNQNMAEAVAQCQNARIVVNGAPAGFAQVDFLYKSFELLREQEALIVNIGSNNVDGVRSSPHPHSASKAALEKAVEQLQYTSSRCRVCLLKLGYVDTERARPYSQPKIPVQDVVESLRWLSQAPEHLLVRQLYISHRDMELDR